MKESERGSILPMFAVVLTLLIIVMAVAIDFSRFVLASEKLQTATDSAAVAAAMSAKRYVRLQVYKGSEEVPCPPGSNSDRCCHHCDGYEIVEGREEDLLEKKGYKKVCCDCGCGRVILLKRWVEYENNGAEAKTAAQMFFNFNKPNEMSASAGGDSDITSINVGNPGSSIYPSTVVHSRGKIKTLMMNFMDKMYPGSNLSELGTSRCAQGGTFYYDVDGSLTRAAQGGCN